MKKKKSKVKAKRKKTSAAEVFEKVFKIKPLPAGQSMANEFNLEQPSFLEIVPTYTTYGGNDSPENDPSAE